MLSAVAAGITFTCTAVSVWDGDGPIRCAEGPKVRLEAIAARELDGSCRRGHPCPAASGVAARDGLVRLLGGPRGRSAHGHVLVAGPPLACRSAGPDAFRRTIARCTTSSGVDLGAAQVRTGLAARWRRFWRAC